VGTTEQARHPWWLFFLGAFLVRALLLPYFADVAIDTGRMMRHYEMAANIADGRGFVHNNSFIANANQYIHDLRRNVDFKSLRRHVAWDRTATLVSPQIDDSWGYAFLLGQIWRMTRDQSYLYIQVLQILLDSVACVLIVASVLMLFHRRRYAYAAGLAYMFFVPAILMTDVPNRDYYAAWGLISSLYLFLRAREQGDRALYFLGSGLAVALFSWFRPTIFLIAFVYGFYHWLKTAPGLRGVLAAARAWALMMLCPLLLFVLPFAGTYHQRYGTYDFGSLSGAALWEGLGELPNPYGFRCSDAAAYARAWELGYPRNEPGLGADFGRLLRADAMRVVRRDPVFYLRVCARRYVANLFLHLPLGPSEKFQVFYGSLGIGLGEFAARYPLFFAEKVLKTVLQFALPLLALLALPLLRGRRREVLLLLLVWQYRILVQVGTHLEWRYVLEGYFPVVVLAAVALVVLWEKARAPAGFSDGA
jgi:hypothetical protein